jgi:hypothetical protein
MSASAANMSAADAVIVRPVPLMSVEVGRAATLLPPVLLAEGSALPLLAPTRCVSLGPRTKY